MEIPQHLLDIYPHLELHTNPIAHRVSGVEIDLLLLKQIETFISERMRIWEKKMNGEIPPYTADPVLRDYRFCNIYRELDKQTIYLHTQLQDMRADFSLWLLNVAFFRFICRPDTIEKVGWLGFDPAHNREVYEKLLYLPRPKFGNAYIFPVSVIQRTENNIREKFFCFELPRIVAKLAPLIQNFDSIGVAPAVQLLTKESGYNFYFHFTEILIDVAYQFPQLIDLFKQFPIGPGSMPTMRQLSKADPELTCLALTGIELPDFPYLEMKGKAIVLSAENWEGIGCEFRKYQNLQKGTGRKRLYAKSV